MKEIIRISNMYQYDKQSQILEDKLFNNANYSTVLDFYNNNELELLQLYLEASINEYDIEYNIKGKKDIICIKETIINEYLEELVHIETMINKTERFLFS